MKQDLKDKWISALKDGEEALCGNQGSLLHYNSYELLDKRGLSEVSHTELISINDQTDTFEEVIEYIEDNVDVD